MGFSSKASPLSMSGQNLLAQILRGQIPRRWISTKTPIPFLYGNFAPLISTHRGHASNQVLIPMHDGWRGILWTDQKFARQYFKANQDHWRDWGFELDLWART